MLKKILITPYFGKFPEWMDKFSPPEGYDWLLDTDLETFKKRVRDKLGIEFPGVYGSPKVWDYRCALGFLYEEEIKGFDFWGTADFDVVWGDMNKFYPDSMLGKYDFISGHNTYMAGCFSLYRNISDVNELFFKPGFWQNILEDPKPSGWVEDYYSRTVEESGLRYKYTFHQGNPWDKEPILKRMGKGLFQDEDKRGIETTVWTEVAFFHFRHSKRWPL